jgi:hypothetical protein
MGRRPRGVQWRGSDCVRPRRTLPATFPPEVGARSNGEYHLRTLQLIVKNIPPQFDPVGLFVAITSKKNRMTRLAPITSATVLLAAALAFAQDQSMSNLRV